MSSAELPILPFKSQQKFADWLTENHNQSDGLWLKLAKKGTNAPSDCVNPWRCWSGARRSTRKKFPKTR
jgi:hypothetical protein